jgi:hypothetical protein
MVSDAFKASVVRDHSATVAVEETTHEARGGLLNKDRLPRFQIDRTLVLSAWTVLREETGPVLRVHRDLDATGTSPEPIGPLPGHCLHRATALLNDSWVLCIRNNAQSPDPTTMI